MGQYTWSRQLSSPMVYDPVYKPVQKEYVHTENADGVAELSEPKRWFYWPKIDAWMTHKEFFDFRRLAYSMHGTRETRIQAEKLQYAPKQAHHETLEHPGRRIHARFLGESWRTGYSRPVLPDTADWETIPLSEADVPG